MNVPRCGLMVVMLLAAAVSAAAQEPRQPSLGDIARQTEAARSGAKKAMRSYTNADLGEATIQPTGTDAPATGYVSATTGRIVSAEQMIAASQEKVDQTNGHNLPEEHWRQRAGTIRSQVEKLTTRLERMQRREPNPNAALQKAVEQEITMLQQTLAGLRRQWATLDESARLARIDMVWIGPAPRFPAQ